MPNAFTAEILIALFVPDSIKAIDDGEQPTGPELTEGLGITKSDGTEYRGLRSVLASKNAQTEYLVTDRAGFLGDDGKGAARSQLAVQCKVVVTFDGNGIPSANPATIAFTEIASAATFYRAPAPQLPPRRRQPPGLFTIAAPAPAKSQRFTRAYPATRLPNGDFRLRVDLKVSWPKHPFHAEMRFDGSLQLVIAGSGMPQSLGVDRVAYLFPACEVLWRKEGDTHYVAAVQTPPRLRQDWSYASLQRPPVSLGNTVLTIPEGFAAIANMKIASIQDVDRLFQSSSFIDWFAGNVGSLTHWRRANFSRSPKTIASARATLTLVAAHLHEMAGLGPGEARFIQFLALFAILTRELGIDLRPKAERLNLHGAFAYNQESDDKKNRVAAALLLDAAFVAQHGGRLADQDLIATLQKDAAGAKSRWRLHADKKTPLALPLRAEDANGGFFRQLDFYKFRGRGLIQSTWRSSYRLLYRELKAYGGSDQEMMRILNGWKQYQDDDEALTRSTDEEWDELFTTTADRGVVLAKAVYVHNRSSGDYLALAQDMPSLVAFTGPGSLGKMATSINGGGQVEYTVDFLARVAQLCTELGNVVRLPGP